MTTPQFVVEHRDGTAVAVVAEELVPIVPLSARLLAAGGEAALARRCGGLATARRDCRTRLSRRFHYSGNTRRQEPTA
jgi:hypothetical protein